MSLAAKNQRQIYARDQDGQCNDRDGKVRLFFRQVAAQSDPHKTGKKDQIVHIGEDSDFGPYPPDDHQFDKKHGEAYKEKLCVHFAGRRGKDIFCLHVRGHGAPLIPYDSVGCGILAQSREPELKPKKRPSLYDICIDYVSLFFWT